MLRTLRGCLKTVIIRAFIVLAMSAVSSGAAAQSAEPQPRQAFAKEAPYRIVVDQITETVTLEDRKGRITEQWIGANSRRTPPLAPIPTTRPVIVELVNANPLLYRYEVSATTAARGRGKSCTNLGDRFAATGALAAMIAMPGQSQGAVLPDRGQLMPPPPPPPGARGGAESLSRDFMAAAAGQLRTQTASYVASLSRIQQISAALDDSIAVAAELGESQPLDSLLESLQRSVERALPGVRHSWQVAAYLRQRLEPVQPVAAQVHNFSVAIRSGLYEGDSTDPAAKEILHLASVVKSAQSSAEPFARKLQSQLRRIELAQANTRQTFTLDASEDYRRISIHAESNGEMPDVLRLRAGRRELFTRPVSALLCEVSVGMAFTDAPPRYALDDGVLVDRDASSERTAPHFMAHLGLSRLPWIAALGGLGFGGQARPDFYLGGTFRALSPVLLNFGAIWQRTDRLENGMRVGSPVSDPSVITDLPRRYRAGFFWGFSFGR